jgi:putative endonuclease
VIKLLSEKCGLTFLQQRALGLLAFRVGGMGPRLRGDDMEGHRGEPCRTTYTYWPVDDTGTLCIGVTNDLRARLEQHRLGFGSEFVRKYAVYRLVHVETYETAEDAIRREKQLKKWKPDWKIQLIEKRDNRDCDLSNLIG